MPYTIAEEQLALARALDDAALNPSGEIRSLVRLTQTLRALPDPEIDPAFAARLEARLLTEGIDELSARRRPAITPVIRPVTSHTPKVSVSPARTTAPVVALPRGRFVVRKAVIGAIAAAMLFALPVVSAGSALPGSPLYGVKIAKEQMELALARGPVADGFVHLRHAHNRLHEVEQLIVIDRDAAVPATLRRYDDAINQGTQLILSATDDPAALARLAAQIRRGTGSLAQLLDVASAVAAPAIIESIATGGELSLRVKLALRQIDDAVSAGPEPVVTVPGSGSGTALGATPVTAPVGPATSPGTGGATNPSAPVAPHPRDGDEGAGSKGADSECVGTLVPDPSGSNTQVCATVATMADLLDGTHGEGHDGDEPPTGCPSAATCGVYALDRHRWATSSGVATLPFVINPAQPWVSPSQAVAAALGAARTWSDANPNVRFDYRGTTSSVPTLGDGVNQIGWGNPAAANALAQANILRVGDRVVEADIVLTITVPWATTHDGAIKRYDIRSVLVHELGHWLGLDHLHSKAAVEQSMFARPAAGETRGATLALGDVKAIRAAYPCGGCAMPSIAADEPAPPSQERASGSSAPAAAAPAPAQKARKSVAALDKGKDKGKAKAKGKGKGKAKGHANKD